MNAAISAKRMLKAYEAKHRNQLEQSLLKLSKEISGERVHGSLGTVVERHLARHFSFERACVLSLKNGRLYSPKCLASEDMGEPLLGLTGRSIVEQRTVVSPYGERDCLYNSDVDNVTCAKPFRNIMVVPLLAKEGEAVGALQLVNYEENIMKLKNVRYLKTVGANRSHGWNTGQLPKEHQ